MREIKNLRLLISQSHAASTATQVVTGGYVDLQSYVHPGNREMKATLDASVTATGSLAVKIQESNGTAGTWSDISGAAFTTLTVTGGTESIHFVTNKRYVRAVATFNPNGMVFTSLLTAHAREV